MLLNKYSMGSFNNLYYHVLHSKRNLVIQDYDQFFFPLDSIKSWNRLYGKRGLSQYQFVLPLEKVDVIKKIFELVSRSNIGSFLVVFKEFGEITSPGLLSFPKKGYTLALDFPNVGKPLWDLYRKLDQLVQLHQGKLYPAKDDHMSSLAYKVFYPNLQEFKQYVDPKFSSSFWRRVGNHEV